MSVDTLHKQMLDDIPNNYQKTIGFPTYDLTHAFAIGAAELEAAIAEEARKLDVDNLTGDDLTRFVQQYRNIVRRAATYAQGVLTVTGNGTVPEGALFEDCGRCTICGDRYRQNHRHRPPCPCRPSHPDPRQCAVGCRE